MSFAYKEVFTPSVEPQTLTNWHDLKTWLEFEELTDRVEGMMNEKSSHAPGKRPQVQEIVDRPTKQVEHAKEIQVSSEGMIPINQSKEFIMGTIKTSTRQQDVPNINLTIMIKFGDYEPIEVNEVLSLPTLSNVASVGEKSMKKDGDKLYAVSPKHLYLCVEIPNEEQLDSIETRHQRLQPIKKSNPKFIMDRK
ncbi:hypothetical protein H5410_004343 [Solanum commersonii]|uniref:Uncharacterized protein n=1 Tax=Solanum commersonii TaxID=4109 RepID=A0A9J6B7R4_SOLCO|nr:hypothetical protein H5410_004343 [Solanum commersonii]